MLLEFNIKIEILFEFNLWSVVSFEFNIWSEVFFVYWSKLAYSYFKITCSQIWYYITLIINFHFIRITLKAVSASAYFFCNIFKQYFMLQRFNLKSSWISTCYVEFSKNNQISLQQGSKWNNRNKHGPESAIALLTQRKQAAGAVISPRRVNSFHGSYTRLVY